MSQYRFVVERTGDEYLAYCDELRAIASGRTKEEALANLREAVQVLLAEYGEDVLEAG